MVAADWNEHARLTQLARTVMGIEGSLTVPDGIDQRSPILVGEWVKTAVIIEPRLIDSLPAPDTPGRVVDIDGTTLRVTVDFATWGETELSLGDAYRALRWDYATVDPTLRLTRSGPALDPYAPGGEPTAGAGSELEIDL